MHCCLKATIYTNKANVPAQMHCDLQANGYVATRLMCRLICNLPEYNIRIFQSACFLLLINRYVFRIADPDTLCCRIAYPTEHYSCCFYTILPYSLCSNKTNVPADVYELLSTAKNLPE
jgi:hypothetical protein